MKKYGMLVLVALLAGCTKSVENMPNMPEDKLTYIVSEKNESDYCNGGDMNSE